MTHIAKNTLPIEKKRLLKIHLFDHHGRYHDLYGLFRLSRYY